MNVQGVDKVSLQLKILLQKQMIYYNINGVQYYNISEILLYLMFICVIRIVFYHIALELILGDNFKAVCDFIVDFLLWLSI